MLAMMTLERTPFVPCEAAPYSGAVIVRISTAPKPMAQRERGSVGTPELLKFERARPRNASAVIIPSIELVINYLVYSLEPGGGSLTL